MGVIDEGHMMREVSVLYAMHRAALQLSEYYQCIYSAVPHQVFCRLSPAAMSEKN